MIFNYFFSSKFFFILENLFLIFFYRLTWKSNNKHQENLANNNKQIIPSRRRARLPSPPSLCRSLQPSRRLPRPNCRPSTTGACSCNYLEHNLPSEKVRKKTQGFYWHIKSYFLAGRIKSLIKSYFFWLFL